MCLLWPSQTGHKHVSSLLNECTWGHRDGYVLPTPPYIEDMRGRQYVRRLTQSKGALCTETLLFSTQKSHHSWLAQPRSSCCIGSIRKKHMSLVMITSEASSLMLCPIFWIVSKPFSESLSVWDVLIHVLSGSWSVLPACCRMYSMTRCLLHCWVLTVSEDSLFRYVSSHVLSVLFTNHYLDSPCLHRPSRSNWRSLWSWPRCMATICLIQTLIDSRQAL